jgi:2-octaprenyl-6-methoxyphenol hydroxylase
VDYEVIISGGGLNGITLALALNHAGISVAIVDKLPHETISLGNFTGRSYALSSASKKMLSVLNLWQSLTHTAQPMLEIKVTDGSVGIGPSPFMMHFNHNDFSDGPMGFVVEDRHLRQSLIKSLIQSDIKYFSETTILKQTLNDSAATVDLDNGKTLTAAVLVGADGRNSKTARAAKINRTGWNYEQSSLVCAIKHEKPHNGIAYQHFLPTGPLAILPLTGNCSGIVWTEKIRTAKIIHALNKNAYLDALRPRVGEFLGSISLVGTREIYSLSLSMVHHMIDARLALVGDAAHVIHPIAGQGLNAGFKDIAALTEVLCEAKRRGQDLGAHSTLDQYQRWRRFDNAMLGVATNGFNNMFSNSNAIPRTIRNLGLAVVNNTNFLRRAFVSNAAGQFGDLPKLLQGKSLNN